MARIADLESVVTGFHVTERHIDCMCGKELLKLEKSSGKILYRKAVFEKEGLSRKLTADEEQIFIYDFCMFYLFSRKEYELLGKWRLGDDLSSDICGMAVDGDTIYCSIRNGELIAIDRRSYSQKKRKVTESSMWSVKEYGKHLVCGTVDGKILLLEKGTLSIEETLVLGKKNIGSLLLEGETLYAASQDGRLFKISLKNLAIETVEKKAHRKAFHCAGLYRDMLVTISYPCSEIALWDKNTLEKKRLLEVPLSLSGCAYLENDSLYITSRNILGIDRISLSE